MSFSLQLLCQLPVLYRKKSVFKPCAPCLQLPSQLHFLMKVSISLNRSHDLQYPRAGQEFHSINFST